ncbi:MAG TPA: TatD family hydrolase [Acholeplasma sp.]|nr:TatD family hydrolase [Acholeplasma sp.]
MLVDTHIHLADKEYLEILDQVIEEAKGRFKSIIVSGIDYQTSLDAIRLAEKYDFLYASIGLHPQEVKGLEDLSWISKLAKHEKVIAIGEIGLDYYWDEQYKEQQKELFIKQIEIANELGLPVIVHSRSAHQDTFDILKEHKTKGVLHCYSGSLEMAKEYTKLGYYLGIGGVVTFKNAKTIKEVVSEVDLKYLLTETDGPYLTPHPYRGKINRPIYIEYVISEIARLQDKTKQEVEDKIYNNYLELFGGTSEEI